MAEQSGRSGDRRSVNAEYNRWAAESREFASPSIIERKSFFFVAKVIAQVVDQRDGRIFGRAFAKLSLQTAAVNP